jgi:hypothetical protein
MASPQGGRAVWGGTLCPNVAPVLHRPPMAHDIGLFKLEEERSEKDLPGSVIEDAAEAQRICVRFWADAALDSMRGFQPSVVGMLGSQGQILGVRLSLCQNQFNSWRPDLRSRVNAPRRTPKRSKLFLGFAPPSRLSFYFTGEVLVGNVGTEFRDQFTALGPHVNFAARLEGRAKSSQILVSQSTGARVESIIPIALAGEISDIKNIPGEFKLFSVE